MFNTSAGRAAFSMFTDEGSLPVFAAFGEERELIYPDQSLREAIFDPFDTKHPDLVTAAVAWRKRLGMTGFGDDTITSDSCARYHFTAMKVGAQEGH